MTGDSLTGIAAGADGNRISYQIDGPADADWLVLSNSLATTRDMWSPQMRALRSARRVLRYDTRGHGRSEASKPPYTREQLAGDAVALLDHLNIARADFMGLSLGGMTGLALAIDHPGRIRRLVCADARADAPDGYKAIWDTNIGKLHAGGIAAISEPTLARWFTEGFLTNPDNAELLETVRSMILATDPMGYEGVGRFLQNLDLLDGISSISCPVLYVTGENDMAAPVAVMQDMADRTEIGSLKVLSDAAHLSNLEQPIAFFDAVRGFLGLG